MVTSMRVAFGDKPPNQRFGLLNLLQAQNLREVFRSARSSCRLYVRDNPERVDFECPLAAHFELAKFGGVFGRVR